MDSGAKRNNIVLAIYFLLAAIEAGVLFANYFSPLYAQAGKTLSGLLDTQKGIAAFLLVLSIAFFVAFVTTFTHSRFWKSTTNKFLSAPEKLPKVSSLILVTIIFVFFTAYLLLNKIFGQYNDFAVSQLYPLFTWVSLFLLQTTLLSVLIVHSLGQKDFSKIYFVTLGGLYALWLFIALTGIGIVPDQYYWNVAGVPVMATQVALILLMGLSIEFISTLLKKHFTKFNKLPVWVDIIICVVIWASATFLWIGTPFGHSFFAKGPFAPNNDFIPYSDAAYTDLGSQYMLIGEGLNYPLFTEKTLYVFFLGILHFLAGQSYLSTTSLQIAFFAIFPVLFYLFGKSFKSRTLGLMLAAFAIIKEHNALIATFKISVSNSRLYMTEFPTSIMMLALGLLVFLWFRKPGKKYLIIAAGGVLGFATMIRSNPLVLLPLLLLAALFVYQFNWKKWFQASLIFLLGFILAVGPWSIRNQVLYSTNTYTQKIQAVINSRFLHKPLAQNPTGNGFYDLYLLNTVPPSNTLDSPQADSESQIKPTSLIDAAHIVAGHFLNNEIKSLFTLPFQYYPQDLNTILGEDYWKEPVIWQGEMPPTTIAFFALNLGLIALGIAFSLKKWHLAGLVPLLLNVGYYLSNALGRTSGSRYLLPVDWVTYFYFLVGIYSIFTFFDILAPLKSEQNTINQNSRENSISKSNRAAGWITAAIILVLGTAIPVVDASFPKLYPQQSEQQIIAKLSATPLVTQTGLSEEQLTDFVSNHNGLILYGRLLYPREYKIPEESGWGIMFTMLTPEIYEIYIQPQPEIDQPIDAGQDVFILGCQQENYIQALAAYLVDSNRTIIGRKFSGTPSCP